MTSPLEGDLLNFTLLKSYPIRRVEYAKEDLAALAAFVFASERTRPPEELTLDLVGPPRIQSLNRRYRGVDRNTDVIAFRYGDKMEWEGDIAINVPQARLQAKKMHHPTRREIRLLLIHGSLHLLGYTDYTPAPRRKMFKRQNELLRRWEKRHR